MTQGHDGLMDRVYRYQRHVYDASRKYYLLGRDELIAGLAPPPGGSVLEIACGTGRNLIEVGKTWPDARLYGLDISTAMLETAAVSVARAGMADRVVMVQGDACAFDAAALFGQAGFDRVFISYGLSMIPDWQTALALAVARVAPGGRLEIVDFGQQEAMPRLWKNALFTWLAAFHVSPRADLAASLHQMAADRGGRADISRPYRGYSIRGGLTLP